MKEKTASVNYVEATAIRVGRWLREKNLVPAWRPAADLRSLSDDVSVGVFRKDPEAKPSKRFFGLITREPLHEFIGTVYYGGVLQPPNEQKWVFEVYGRKNVELAKQLATEMASTFTTNITVQLVQEEREFKHVH